MLKPLGHRVLVEVDKVEERTKGGLYIPEDTRQREQLAHTRGTVVAVGDTAFKDFGGGPWAVIGDRVVFAKYAGVESKDDGKEYRILNDEDLIAKVGA